MTNLYTTHCDTITLHEKTYKAIFFSSESAPVETLHAAGRYVKVMEEGLAEDLFNLSLQPINTDEGANKALGPGDTARGPDIDDSVFRARNCAEDIALV